MFHITTDVNLDRYIWVKIKWQDKNTYIHTCTQINYRYVYIHIYMHIWRWAWRVVINCVSRSTSAFAVRKQPDNRMPWHAFLNTEISIHADRAIYNSFMMSNFNYCSHVWHSYGQVNNQKLVKNHERALRILFADYNSSYNGTTWKSWHHHSTHTAASSNRADCI